MDGPSCPQQSEEGIRPLGTGVPGSCKLLGGCWKPHSGSLQEQKVSLALETPSAPQDHMPQAPYVGAALLYLVVFPPVAEISLLHLRIPFLFSPINHLLLLYTLMFYRNKEIKY